MWAINFPAAPAAARNFWVTEIWWLANSATLVCLMLGNSNHDYFYFLLHWLLYYIQFTALEVNTFILFLYAYRYFHVYSLYSWILNFNSQPLLATQRMTAFDFAHTICTICVTFHAAFVIDGSFYVHFWFAV